MKIFILWFLCLGFLPFSVAADKLVFDVFLDDKKIGLHQVDITSEDEHLHVTVKADMRVDVLFLNVFSYEHQAKERWQNDCIAELETQTNDDGDKLMVKGMAKPDGFEVVTQSSSKMLSDCVRTFAYWNPDLLSASYLLNTQNGLYEPASLSDRKAHSLDFNDRTFGNYHYRLSVGEDVVIDLWYDNADQWVALETEVANGRKLRYIRQEQS